MHSNRERGSQNDSAADDKNVSPRTPLFQTYGSLGLTLAASVFSATASVLVKLMTHVSVPKIVLVRGVGTFLVNLPFLLYCARAESALSKSDVSALVVRGLSGAGTVYLNFLSWKLMPIAESTVILSTTLLWVILLSKVVLKENLDLLNSLSIVFSMLGLVSMSRVVSYIFSSGSVKYSDANYWYGCLCALLASLLLALTAVLLRKMKNIHEFVILSFQSGVTIVVSAVAVLGQWDLTLPECGFEGTALVSMGVLAFLGEVLITKAMKYDKAAAVSSIRSSSQLIFRFVFQVSIFNEIPDVYSSLAIVFVLTSLCLSGVRKYRQGKRRNRTRRTGSPRNKEAVTTL